MQGYLPPGARRRVSIAVAALLAAASAAFVPMLPASASPPHTSAAPVPAIQQALPAPVLQHQGVVPGQVLVTLDGTTSVTGGGVTGGGVTGGRFAARAPQTSNSALDARLAQVGAQSLRPVIADATAASDASASAQAQLGDAADVSRTYVLQTSKQDSDAVVRALQGAPGLVSVASDRYVNTMNVGGMPLPAHAPRPGHGGTPGHGTPGNGLAAAIPGNDALASSSQALLNSGGVDAVGAFALLGAAYGQQPGQGETITNVSIGDLTDQSMADGGDTYVQGNGPTTVVEHGQRYLDLPSMPLIPTYVAKADGTLDPTGSTENQDATLDEVMLDFSVMSPLAHDKQRPAATGVGYTDLLGIAPGANYRLVVPEQPTMDGIADALLAAAHQSPRPNIITASLGVGTDQEGFPGRYLEDDPMIRSIVASIVRSGIVVVISSNDGTRTYTPAAVGPDGGSTPTDLAPNAHKATNIDDVAGSTTPSLDPDTGAIAAGGTTLDDTLSDGAAGPATTVETRISGFGTFSSGFGSRIDLSAPSDNVVAFEHAQSGQPQDVNVVLSGGTSASAPEIAAAAAVVLQAGKLSGQHLTPADVRRILEQTGRDAPTPAQIDRDLPVGPQIDVTAAVEKVLGSKAPHGTQIVRLGVEHHVTFGGLGGAFLETTDPATIDLSDSANGGSGLLGPITFAGDVLGSAATGPGRGSPASPGIEYTLTVGHTVVRSGTPAIRVTPAQLLTAAGQPVVSDVNRSVTVTYAVTQHGRTLASVARTLTVGPTDGTHQEASAPAAPATVSPGHNLTVSYDLTGVTGVDDPYLVLSGVGHWNPALGPIFAPAWSVELPADTPKGAVTIPASAFDGGGGIYGVGIATSQFTGNPAFTTWSEFASVRVDGGSPGNRPVTPLVAGATGPIGHAAEVTRAHPSFGVSYDVRGIKGAKYTEVELSAPAPTLRGSNNTFTNANGTQLDNDGVNTPSSAHWVLAGTHGTARLDAIALGLSTSHLYSVRVLALDARRDVIGQASPVSSLYVDDAPAPTGDTVLSYGTDGPHSVVALRTASGGTEVRHYDPATGVYGGVIASDPTSGSDYEALGASDDRALVIHAAAPGGDVTVESWDTVHNTIVGSTTLPVSQYAFVVGTVDRTRDRAAILLRSATTNADLVLPVDLTVGTTADPIPADPPSVPAGTYTLLDIDTSTGTTYLAKGVGPFNCFGSVHVAAVDLTTRTVSDAGLTSGCSHGFWSDDAGTLYNVSASSFSARIAPTAIITPFHPATGESGDSITLRQAFPDTLAIDGVHHLALVSFSGPDGPIFIGSPPVVLDNNATGQIVEVDLATGEIVKTINGFLFAIGGGPLIHGGAMNAIQLDPATRTGWTYSPVQDQLQQFSY